MSAVPYMKFYIGDYLGDTQHLTTFQHGAYLLLIMAYWQRRGPLPNDDEKLARIVGCASADWLQCKSDVLAFFDIEDGLLYHGRIERELESVADISEKRRGAAYKKWNTLHQPDAIAKQEQSNGNAIDMLSHIHSHSHIHSSNIEPKEREEADKPPRQTFVKPSFDEIKAYCKERSNTVDPQRFIDFYESKGWMIGKNKMKDWRAAVRTWERSEIIPKPEPKHAIAGRGDALTAEEIAEHREAIENAEPLSAEELAELERIKAEAAQSPIGRAVIGMLGG